MEKHLYVIGNGFDLHHDILSDYRYFRDWLVDNAPCVLQTIDETFGYHDWRHIKVGGNKEDDRWWRTFEENLSSALTYEIAIEEARENQPDFGSDDFSDADWYDAEYAVENKLEDAYSVIREAFQNWVAQLGAGSPRKKIRIFRDNSLFLNFNYSHTLQVLYDIPDHLILHIHGKAGSENKLVLGHGKSYDEIKAELEAEASLDEHLTDEEKLIDYEEDGDDFITMRAKDAAVAGVYNQRKKTDEIITKNEDWFNQLKDVTHLHIFGHSFGRVDLPYFQKILSVIKKEKVFIEVNWFTEDDKINIQNFFDEENIYVNLIQLNDILITT